MVTRILLFLVLNFAALGIGGFFTGSGVSSSWYAELSKAPWTPPGWVFGVAWTTIMICFSFYMAFLLKSNENKNLIITLFITQWILNILWNPVFFYYHNALLGLIVITALTLIVGTFIVKFWGAMGLKNILIFPYFIWLLIASSLNAFILFKN
jgi:tryptophan-rich sensory protein